MSNEMKERRKVKITNFKECRRLSNQMRRETYRIIEVYMEEICDKILDPQRKGRYDLIYQKAQQLGGRPTKTF